MVDSRHGDTVPQTPLTVLWLIKGLGPGGAEMLLVNQARAARGGSINYQVGYLVPWKNHLVPELEAAGVPASLFRSTRAWDIRWLWQLRRHLGRNPVDVIHIHSPYVAALTRVMVRTLPRARRPAIVYTEHNEWARHDPLTRLANRVTFALDDANLAVSDQVRASMPPKVAASVEVLVHGIDIDAVRAHLDERDRTRAELGLGSDDIAVGIVANFRKEKAYDDWITAAGLVSEALPVRFISVGQGPLEESMRELVRERGLDDRVLLLGYREDALSIMAAFDIFTLSSIHEGLPVSLMDALALGLPVVATTAGGIPQAIDDGIEGLLVPPRQPRRLAASIQDLAEDAQRRSTMADAAGDRAGDFDVKRALATIEARYADVVRSRSETLEE